MHRNYLLYFDVAFYDLVVYTCTFDFFDAFLDEGIPVEGDGEGEGFAFPVLVGEEVEVFGVLVTGEGVAAAAGGEGGPVVEEREVGVVEDLDHFLVFGVVGDGGVAVGDGRTGDELPGAGEVDLIGFAGDGEE